MFKHLFLLRPASAIILFLTCCLPLFLLSACSQNTYKKVTAHPSSELKTIPFRPDFDKVLYRCNVEGKKYFNNFYMSGLLFMKYIGNDHGHGEYRVIFQNEMGMTYFDFGWYGYDSFTVHHIIPQLNKKVLIESLKSDFEILLVHPSLTNSIPGQIFQLSNPDLISVQFELKNNHYVNYNFLNLTDTAYILLKADYRNKNRNIASFEFSPSKNNELPDSIIIKHLRAGFKINLQKISNDVKG